MAPEEIDNFFQPFEQTETGRKFQHGTGLGLPISPKFIQLMGGDISVNSKVGLGTKFTFEIEVGITDLPETQTAAAQKNMGLALHQFEYRILVVETLETNHAMTGDILIIGDIPENMKLLSKLLRNKGHKVRAVTNGKMGLRAVDAKAPDLILLDINMPEMNGYEVCERLKAVQETQNIPVVFL